MVAGIVVGIRDSVAADVAFWTGVVGSGVTAEVFLIPTANKEKPGVDARKYNRPFPRFSNTVGISVHLPPE